MTFNRTQIDKILDMIFPLPEEFGTYEGEEFEGIYRIEKNIHTIDPKATIAYGISKLVIIAPSIGNVVIKIPFNGYFYEVYIDEESDDTELTWLPFDDAEGSDPSDYCLTEYEKYQNLKKYNLNRFVAEVIFYTERDGIRVFLQEKVTSVDDSYHTPIASKKSKDLVKRWSNERFQNGHCILVSEEWLANCIDAYGVDNVQEFVYYCDNVDPSIVRDMHSGNYGYREDNSPVILDYSDFND